MVIFEIQYRLVLLKDKSLNLLEKVLIVRLMLIILTRLRVGLSHLREHIFRQFTRLPRPILQLRSAY